jgi:Ca2+-binding EF-hand superfamily protein
LIFRSIQLRPPLKEIKAILGQAGTLKLNYQQVKTKQFQTLRLSKKRCELNVIANFKKFEDRIHKGYITQRSIEDALFSEGQSRTDISYIAATLMKIDRNRDGFITYKELYNFLMGAIPEEWIKWLVEK